MTIDKFYNKNKGFFDFHQITPHENGAILQCFYNYHCCLRLAAEFITFNLAWLLLLLFSCILHSVIGIIGCYALYFMYLGLLHKRSAPLDAETKQIKKNYKHHRLMHLAGYCCFGLVARLKYWISNA